MAVVPESVVNSPGSTGSVTSFTTDVPAGTVDGDLLMWTLVGNTATVASTPAGWNIWKVSTTTGLNSSTFYRIASSEPSSYTHASLTSARWGGGMIRFSGHDPVTPLDVAVPTRVAGTSGFGYPPLTPVTAGALIVAIGASIGPSGTVNANWSAGNMSSVITDYGSNVAAAANAFGAHGTITWPGGAFTPTGPVDDYVSTRTIGDTSAIRPAAASIGLPILVMPPRAA